ncbi:hypothetical protein [Streptomyces sp. NPDC059452]|uniref:hypothetical protein n=1 Tax=Streptomyces sp. NPDC059452 TaxID=3346835 RepID=UPI00367EA6C0
MAGSSPRRVHRRAVGLTWTATDLRAWGRGTASDSTVGPRRTRDAEIQPVLDHAAVFFYLDNQQLRSIQMVERLDAHRTAIHQAIEKGGPSAYAVRHDRIERTWPP